MSSIILEAQNLSFVLRPHTPLFQSLSFQFQSGDVVCLLGNNGSGKSFFLKVCAGLVAPSNGTLRFNHQDVHRFSPADRAQKIAWLPQMLERTEQLSALDFLNLSSDANFTEEKDWKVESERFDLKHLFTKNLMQLSGGEWKRVQLAKLWSRCAPLLLLDEPDNHLDLRHKMALAEHCHLYAKIFGAIVVIVTHDMSFAKQVAQHILAFDRNLLVWNSCAQDFWHSDAPLKLFGTRV